MYTYASFSMPPVIIYGSHAFEKVGELTAERGKKALIVSDRIMEKLGNVEKCRHYLTSSEISSVLYLDVDSEPTDRYVTEALKLYIAHDCDVIVSLGGGSCIDTAKAVAVLATNGGYTGDYMDGKKLAKNAPVPHIAIPTTAGTGSEATDVTVITNTSNHVKMMVKQPAFMPACAIVDPILTVSSPKNVTAATGIDALSHAIEAYLSKKAHPMTDMYSLSAMKLIVEYIESAYHEGDNIAAREKMSLGSLQAGIAFSNASVCLVHGMSRPIGALFHVPHGISNAMLLPAVLEYSKDACVDRLADLGRIFERDKAFTNEEAAEVAIASVKKLCARLDIPNLKSWGIEEGTFRQSLAKMAKDAIDSGSPANHPKVPSVEELMELYMVCYDYPLAVQEISGKPLD